MRILFLMASPEYLRYYDSTIRLLAERGHTVFVGVNQYSKNQRKSARLERIADATGRIAIAGVVPRRDDAWQTVAKRLRGTMDYVRFLDPHFKDTPFLRRRMMRKALPASLRVLARLSTLPRPLVRGIVRFLEMLERAIPSSKTIEAFLRSLNVDAVIVSPLVDAASDQVDYIKSAKALGLRSAAGIASWDNLTNKGLLRVRPDMIFVWNAIQRTEAVELHGADPSSVVVTGAQLFDRWFGRLPSVSREMFCASAGLRAERRFVLFVGSTAFISSPDAEVQFVRKWVRALRTSPHPDVRDLGVLVRPHPYNCEQWIDADLSDLGDVAVWPKAGASPVDEGDRAAYFDSLYYSAAVVGINTSAMIEAAIVGRPVHTILAPEFSATQRGTVHFQYLMPDHGGFVRVASDFGQHIEQLQQSLRPAEPSERPDEFLVSFVRPFGLDTPSTPIMAGAIERLASQPPRRIEQVSLWLLPLTVVLRLAGTLIGGFARKKSQKARAEHTARADSPLRILFLTGHFALLRNFDSVIETLASRGHRVRLIADADEMMSGKRERLGGNRLVERLVERNQLISIGWTPDRKADRWADLAKWIRLSIDYLRYKSPAYQNAAIIVARAEQRTPGVTVWLSRLPLLRSRSGLKLLAWGLGVLERSLPVSRIIAQFLIREQPDIVLITPLLNLGSAQYDYLRCAKRLGIRTALCVTSWDHLSSKALIRETPDLVLVWNEIQKTEAMELHGVPPERVVVTGAQCYDHWFTWRPSMSQEEFLKRVGLQGGWPYILYVCSAIFKGTGSELRFVRRWIGRLRDLAQGDLKEAGILIRPHPARIDEWVTADLTAWGNVAVWPRASANPIDPATRADYYDSMYHSAAIVGINTSALIEAGIVGRPVFTILSEELAGSQVGTLHFHYLMNVNGGLLHVARTLDESVHMLNDLFGRQGPDSEKNRRFVEAFVRPHGIDVEATPRFVDAVEQMARSGQAAPQRAPLWSLPITGLLHVASLFTPLLKGKAASSVKTVGKIAARALGASPRWSWRPTDGFRQMRVLFVMRYPGYLRYFGSTVKLLADRGHTVILAFDTIKKQAEGLKALEQYAGSIEVRGKWQGRMDVWSPLARRVRGLMDYVRYLHPSFRDARYLRDRMIPKLPKTFEFLTRIDSLNPGVIRAALACLSICEAAIPPARTVKRFVKSVRPDVVLVTPLVNPASTQMEFMKVCEAFGIPTAACIASWDHLTTKGLIRAQPDLVAVWNETQKREAIELHGIPPSRIAVTGAQPFDDWFGRDVGVGYEEFCRTVGLDPRRRFVLFVGSTASISKPDAEVNFVRRWAGALRTSGEGTLREIGILVRPHPYNAGHWKQADLSDLGNVTIWPRTGANPVDAADRADYFASLYHAAAVVGINTSAMIEAAIVGRPVHTILAPEFKETQSGTVHFHYLLPENGGFARASVTLEQHLRQLAEAVTNGDAMREAASRFVESFIRPRGLATPGTPLLVQAIEALPRTARPRRRRMRALYRPLTVFLWILARIIAYRESK